MQKGILLLQKQKNAVTSVSISYIQHYSNLHSNLLQLQHFVIKVFCFTRT